MQEAFTTRSLYERSCQKVYIKIFLNLSSLKFSRNTKVTRALTGQRPWRPAADDDFEI